MNIESFVKMCVTRYTYRRLTRGEICTQTGQVIYFRPECISTPTWEHRGSFTSMALSIDKRVLFATDGFDLHFLDMATGNLLKAVDMPRTHPNKIDNYVPAMILSVDGHHLFITDAYKCLYKWDIAKQTHIQTYDLRHIFPDSMSIFTMLGVSLDGRFLFCCRTNTQLVVLNMITDTVQIPAKDISIPDTGTTIFGTWEAILSVLQEQSWEMDFCDLLSIQV